MKNMDLRIGSINTRGLEAQVEQIFNWYIFIQETYCTEDNIHDWRAEWGYQALFSCCCSNKAGVAILFNNNFSLQRLKAYTDPKRRFIICDLITTSKKKTLKGRNWNKQSQLLKTSS